MKETNYYHQHKDAIREICEAESVDLGVAIKIYGQRNGDVMPDLSGVDKHGKDCSDIHANEFLEELRDMTGKEVKAYFYDER